MWKLNNFQRFLRISRNRRIFSSLYVPSSSFAIFHFKIQKIRRNQFRFARCFVFVVVSSLPSNFHLIFLRFSIPLETEIGSMEENKNKKRIIKRLVYSLQPCIENATRLHELFRAQLLGNTLSKRQVHCKPKCSPIDSPLVVSRLTHRRKVEENWSFPRLILQPWRGPHRHAVRADPCLSALGQEQLPVAY